MPDSALGGYTVLDIADEKGYYCGKLLADLGAEVVKVEPLGGDAARQLGPFFHDTPDPNGSLPWLALNAGKRGITLDIASTEGKRLFLALAESADVLVESFSPGYMAALGLDYAALHQLNPGLVYVSISGFGQTGPHRDFQAPDLVVMAMAGIMHITGDPGRTPLRIGVPQAYMHTGAEAAIGAMIALWSREIDGEGQHVDVSAQESVMWETFEAQQAWYLNHYNAQRAGDRRNWGRSRFRWIFRSKDGFLCFPAYIAAGIAVRTRQALTRWIAEEGMADEYLLSLDWEQINTFSVEQEVVDSYEEYFVRFLKTKTNREILERTVKEGLMMAPHVSTNDILEDAHHRARGFLVDIVHPELGTTLTYAGAPYLSTETPYVVSGRAPLIGEHNEEIFVGGLGLSQDQFRQLEEEGVV